LLAPRMTAVKREAQQADLCGRTIRRYDLGIVLP
jgi:hypothetical protein